MYAEKTKLDKVLLINPDEVYEDYRGYNLELYNQQQYDDLIYKELGQNINFVADKISVSNRNVFRGIHGDSDTWKLIGCLSGKILLIVINYDENHPQFGHWEKFILSENNNKQILVPPMFGNGHLVLSEIAIFWYKWSEYYNLEKQFTIIYDDPRFKIRLPIDNLILADRDRPL